VSSAGRYKSVSEYRVGASIDNGDKSQLLLF
jgi:hypothetical protein